MSNHRQGASPRSRIRRWAGLGGLALFAGCARTPPPAPPAMPVPVAVYTAPEPRPHHPAPKANPVLVSNVQGELMRLDYLQTAPDGALGPKTKAAIKRFQFEHGMHANGSVSKTLLDRLQATPSGAPPGSQ
ncbi:MAG: peptidoglycan-binding domain-containing protein [Acetobacteraceae bacterium]